jgi:hypothetical protein
MIFGRLFHTLFDWLDCQIALYERKQRKPRSRSNPLGLL